MQLKEDDVCLLLKCCEAYKRETGSEYMVDKVSKVMDKLHKYGEEYSPERLQCDTNGTRHHTRDSDSSITEQSRAVGREAVGAS